MLGAARLLLGMLGLEPGGHLMVSHAPGSHSVTMKRASFLLLKK